MERSSAAREVRRTVRSGVSREGQGIPLPLAAPFMCVSFPRQCDEFHRVARGLEGLAEKLARLGVLCDQARRRDDPRDGDLTVLLADIQGACRGVTVAIGGFVGSRSDGAPSSAPALSTHETRILSMLVEGHNYRTMAAALSVSVNTISFHMKRIYEKLDVHSKSQAVARALRDGLVPPNNWPPGAALTSSQETT